MRCTVRGELLEQRRHELLVLDGSLELRELLGYVVRAAEQNAAVSLLEHRRVVVAVTCSMDAKADALERGRD